MDQQEEIKQLKKSIEELTNLIKSFFDNGTMPLDLGEAIKARLNVTSGVANGYNDSTVTPASKTITITGNDAAKPMAGFIRVVIRGVSYNIPYY